MKLVETVTTYKTLELLKSMVDISADHFNKYDHVIEKATIFSFGRQCGHTEAIKEYVSQSEDEILVVCHNQYKATEFNRTLGFNAAVSISDFKRFEKFRGCNAEPVKIIFDSCPTNQIKSFILESLEYRVYDIKAIVIVQPAL
jgi:regulator of sigma D